jgi:peptide/nickel transport system permease protein
VLFVLPGDPAQIMLGTNATPETLANLRTKLGLDQPFWVQYADWIYNLLNGTGSRSINYDVPVYDLLLSSLTVTGPLALMAMFFAVIISVPLGIHAARHQNRPADVTVMFFTQLGLATPEFWLGILLMLWLSVKLLGLISSPVASLFCSGRDSSVYSDALNPIFHAGGTARRLYPHGLGQGT